jgi:hypothetical protein
MEKQPFSVSGLYYRYKKTSDDEIRKYLNNIMLVKVGNKGIDTVHGYYRMSDESLAKIIEKPRNVSLTFDANATGPECVKNLKPWKEITYLVKSSSRFFLKPDVGEIFDAIPYHDLLSDRIKAICINLDDHELLPDTDGEHFLMSVFLLV